MFCNPQLSLHRLVLIGGARRCLTAPHSFSLWQFPQDRGHLWQAPSACSLRCDLTSNRPQGAMVASSRGRKKQVQQKKKAVEKEIQEDRPQAAEPSAEDSAVKEEPSTSKSVRIYADGKSVIWAPVLHF